MKSWSEDLEGKASDASEDILFVSRGRGYCWAREGLDNLPNILAFLAGSKSLAWLAHLRTAYRLVVVGPCWRWTPRSPLSETECGSFGNSAEDWARGRAILKCIYDQKEERSSSNGTLEDKNEQLRTPSAFCGETVHTSRRQIWCHTHANSKSLPMSHGFGDFASPPFLESSKEFIQSS
jgi:hypothetical protein